jgi:hypothetical protein
MAAVAADLFRRMTLTTKTLSQYQVGSIARYGLYRFGLWTGHYRRSSPIGMLPQPTDLGFEGGPVFEDVLPLPSVQDLRQVIGERMDETVQEAEEIVAGLTRRFGGPPVPLELELPDALCPLKHWTDYERGKQHWLAGQDIKFLWEPARFGWVYPLARAFRMTADERYAQAFWSGAEHFLQANPPNLGPQWSSAQEVALRLIALAFAGQVFRGAKTTSPERLTWLGWAVAAHAQRIPLTLVYARSQANNHLITEAAGLITAACALPAHPKARSWRQIGRKAFEQAIIAQIRPDGTYIQHSTNYHRLMLSIALWVHALLSQAGENLSEPVLDNLGRASGWLAQRLDPVSGRVPNLGHNDGAHILPLASGGFSDYRPVVQAAGETFCGQAPLPTGAWDELPLWLRPSFPIFKVEKPLPAVSNTPPTILHSHHSWAELRAVTFQERPAHADQLHVDLWWRGTNIAMDPGTYLYNAPSPWENALATTRVHNTIEIDRVDQMTRAGRFRWVDWAQARVNSSPADLSDRDRITASHAGYSARGVLHRRTLAVNHPDIWSVTDELIPLSSHQNVPHHISLRWLLPDMPWSWQTDTLELRLPHGIVHLRIHCGVPGGQTELPINVSLTRCGEPICGTSVPDPILGWYSPTYGQKIPALLFAVDIDLVLPLTLTSDWTFVDLTDHPQYPAI